MTKVTRSSMDRTRWIIFAVICAVLIGLLVFTRDSGTTFTGDPAKVTEDDNVYGKRDSKVVLIEYGDFQCPGCGALFPELKTVKEEYKDHVAIVFRHLPLTSIHPNAKAAAAAAQAAAEQGKFWEMHDMLYIGQNQWGQAQPAARTTYFEGYAGQIGLDIEKFRTDVASKEVNERVNRDLSAARQAGFKLSTPTVILNGKQVDSAEMQVDGKFSADKLRELLNNALKAEGIEPPKVDATKPAAENPGQ